MRTLATILFCIMLLAATGCKDEGPGPHPVEFADVTGSWSLRQASLGYNDEPQTVLVDSDAFSYPPRFRWNFSADGQMSYNYPTNGSTSDSLTWRGPLAVGGYSFNPETSALIVPIDVVSTMTTSAIEDPATYTVLKQTQDSLVLEERKREIHPTQGDSATAIYIARFLREG